MILTQTVTVALFSNNDFENENINDKILAKITCYCGTSSQVFKTVSHGHTKKRWILRNYFRHLNKYFLNNDLKPKKVKGKLVSNTSSINSIQHYISLVQCPDDNSNSKTPSTSIQENKELSSMKNAAETTGSLDISKWKNPKYSLSNRDKRRYEKSLLLDDKKQIMITDFYEIVDCVKAVIVKSTIIKDSLGDLKKNSKADEQFLIHFWPHQLKQLHNILKTT
ncbi:unnamed protein product [Macrosiphum euphorbiae]|uniref:Uncharacterized protein n=1 Tax=Macrosiphum euphorbiae TaxID=13131 RepID=A0AAV0VS98_9HEMI|nr:unnamed protein product [Macrosiphum euphorbiae]